MAMPSHDTLEILGGNHGKTPIASPMKHPKLAIVVQIISIIAIFISVLTDMGLANVASYGNPRTDLMEPALVGTLTFTCYLLSFFMGCRRLVSFLKRKWVLKILRYE